ncbi:MAG TPA: hypothetical protein VE133_04630, partial [Candidatus Sulfotelmatobacter sp.]|nr:hypothetical protein [Candidatus Sulfotelmatobacter sp.]
WIYSRSLSMSWKPRLSGIATGFFIYLSVSVSAVFIRARWPLAAAAIAGRVGMCSYLVAVLVWVTVLWGPAPEEKPATEAMMHELEQHHRENMNAVDILRSAIR